MGQGLSRSLAPAGTLWKEESPARGQEGMRHAKERAGELALSFACPNTSRLRKA